MITEAEKQDLVGMIKELNLDPSRQVDLIQRLEHEGLTEELKRELLAEVQFAETSLIQEDELAALINKAYSNPDAIPGMITETGKQLETAVSQAEADLAKAEASLKQQGL